MNKTIDQIKLEENKARHNKFNQLEKNIKKLGKTLDKQSYEYIKETLVTIKRQLAIIDRYWSMDASVLKMKNEYTKQITNLEQQAGNKKNIIRRKEYRSYGTRP